MFKYSPMEDVEGQRERLLFINGYFSFRKHFLWEAGIYVKEECLSQV